MRPHFHVWCKASILAFTIVAFVGGAAPPGHAEDCSFYRGVPSGASAPSTTITVNWQSKDSGGFPANCIGSMWVHEPGGLDWYGNPPETTPSSTHVSTATVPKANTWYEYLVYGDFDGDGTACLLFNGLIMTGGPPPSCSNMVLPGTLTQSTTSTSFTISFTLEGAASARLAYRRADDVSGPWTYVTSTTSGVSHVIAVTGLASSVTYAYNVEALCASTGDWDFVEYGSVTTNSAGGGDKKEHIKQLAMTKVWPIPSTGSAHLRFVLPREMAVRVDIFDVQGRMVRNVVSGTYPAGEFEVQWDGRVTTGLAAPTGVYFARLQAGRQSSIKRLLIARK